MTVRHVGGAVGVGEHDDAPLAVLAQDLVGPVGLAHVGDLAHRDPARGRLDQQIAQALRGAPLVLQPQHDVEAPVAVDHARDDAAVGQALELLGDRRGLQAVERGALVVDDDLELRNAHLLLDLQVDDARHR